MYPTATLVAVLFLAPVALAEEGGGAVPIPPSVRGSISVGKALTPTQRIATLEETLNTETNRRVELEGSLGALTQENTRLATAQEALVRDKAAVDGELGRTREALTRAQRDFEALRAGYVVITRIIDFSFPVIAAVMLFIFALLGWLIFMARRLAVRVHDVPTIAQIREYDGHIAHLREQLNVEKTHVAMLKERLSKLGIAE